MQEQEAASERATGTVSTTLEGSLLFPVSPG